MCRFSCLRHRVRSRGLGFHKMCAGSPWRRIHRNSSPLRNNCSVGIISNMCGSAPSTGLKDECNGANGASMAFSLERGEDVTNITCNGCGQRFKSVCGFIKRTPPPIRSTSPPCIPDTATSSSLCPCSLCLGHLDWPVKHSKPPVSLPGTFLRRARLRSSLNKICLGG
jgi:hypothetical protein